MREGTIPMPTMAYDQNSGALLFTPTADELEQVQARKKIQELEQKIAQLEAILATLLENQR
jgi:hypothetical protein